MTEQRPAAHDAGRLDRDRHRGRRGLGVALNNVGLGVLLGLVIGLASASASTDRGDA